MAEYGLIVKQDSGGQRVELQCEHQNGLLYVVPGDSSWVCSDELRHAHALAGFFRELMELDDDRVQGLMQKWGLYYRPRSIVIEEKSESESG
ncbi:MAG: hypothetical protein IIC24_09605 [Chloroflexi bacterium]|nr:hypothetical protein [Chloroflexota bacterium]MCH8310803.1 hypothetical protein [Chloroflexota bacterium]